MGNIRMRQHTHSIRTCIRQHTSANIYSRRTYTSAYVRIGKRDPTKTTSRCLESNLTMRGRATARLHTHPQQQRTHSQQQAHASPHVHMKITAKITAMLREGAVSQNVLNAERKIPNMTGKVGQGQVEIKRLF